MKNKQLATASVRAAATGVTKCELVLPSWHCFRNPDHVFV